MNFENKDLDTLKRLRDEIDKSIEKLESKPKIKPFPKVMRCTSVKNPGMLVLFLEKKEGYVLTKSKGYDVGHYSITWMMHFFEDTGVELEESHSENEYPKLMISDNAIGKRTLVLFTSSEDTGYVVKDEEGIYNVGEFRNDWLEVVFTDFTGKLKGV